MGHRLTKIYTRTGDDGSTGLADGSRLPKHSARIEAMGAVDELNSSLGVLLATVSLDATVRAQLTAIQHELFDLGADLSIPGRASMTGAQVTRLENHLDAYNAKLSPLKEFILPGGSRAAALCHVSRTVCRRAERRLAAMAADANAVSPLNLKYLNRLSDYLFVLCRELNRQAGRADVLWQQHRAM